jgi:hypothetical protein
MGDEATGHVAALELPWEPEPRDTRACMHVLSFVLTQSLYTGVPGLQGTDSGPRVHPGRGYKPTGGAIIFPVHPS